MDDEWCCEKLENLKIEEDRLATLTEIRWRLNEANRLETNIMRRLLNAPEIYECVDDTTENGSGYKNEQFDIVSDILSICMSNLSISQSDLPQLLQRALTHKQPHIRALALHTILKELERVRGTNSAPLGMSNELLLYTLDAMQQEETEVGITALKILAFTLEEHLEQQEVKAAILCMLNGSDAVKCRTYELAVILAKRSPATLNKVEFILDCALAELDNDDILLKVNILEILVSLAEQNHGLNYLETHQVFEVISKRADTLEQDPLDHLLLPGILRYFGKIACVQPQKIISGYPNMLLCLFENLHKGDLAILPTAFDTLANLAATNQGKLLLNEQYSAAMKVAMEDCAVYLRRLPSDLKSRGFNTLEVIFNISDQITPEISCIMRQWFTYLADSENMHFLLSFCRMPFPDIKVACLSFIKTLCLYRWGITALKNTAGFMEYLFNRKAEFDKEVKYAKYEVIKLLALSSAFDVQTELKLRTYVNEGPYFIETIMDVAVEGGDSS